VSFRRRITFISAAAVTIAVVIASALTYLFVSNQLRRQIDKDLRSTASTRRLRQSGALRGLLSPGGRGLTAFLSAQGLHLVDSSGKPVSNDVLVGLRQRFVDSGPFGRLPDSRPGQVNAYEQFIDAHGTVTAEPGQTFKLPLTPAVLALARSNKPTPLLFDTHAGGLHLRVLAESVGSQHAFEIARPLTQTDDTLSNVRLILVLVDIGCIALAALLGRGVAGAAIAPVKRLTRTAEHVAATRDLSQRIEPSGGDELGRLARSFNAMLDALGASMRALDNSVHAQRQLVADASHELRTPVTSLRTNLEIMQAVPDMPAQERDRLIGDAVEQAEELTLLMTDIIELARGERPDEQREEVRLDEVVAGAVERHRLHSPATQFEVELEPTLVEGIASRLERAVSNLIDNAVKWSPEGGPVDVVLRDGEVRVRDHGPGISPEDLPHVFDRFYRAASARHLPGSGLGLSIVRQVARSHGGDVTAENGPDGGAVFRLRLGS
jgi:two-component system, OmpR family, sensor histidine kinase MprB